MQKETTKPIPFIRKLCRDKTEDEILAAEDRFSQYLLLIKEICMDMEEPSIDG